MAVLKSKDDKGLLLDCYCSCDMGIRLRIEKDDTCYCMITYTNGNFYTEQGETVCKVIRKKFRKIWAIIRNKDFYYSDIVMTRDEFAEFKAYINGLGDKSVIKQVAESDYICPGCGCQFHVYNKDQLPEKCELCDTYFEWDEDKE